MQERRWRVLFKLSMVTLLCCVLTVFTAHAADDETLERLEKIIQQQQEQIAAQQKALEQLQGEVKALKAASPSAAQTTVPEGDKVLAEAVSEEQKGACHGL